MIRLILLLMICLICCSCHEVNSSTASSVPGKAWGRTNAGLRSRVWTDKATFGTSGPIVVHYEINNVSDKVQVVWHSGFWPNHLVRITDANGVEVPLTPAGAKLRKMFQPDGDREKNVPWRIEPGKSDSAWIALDLRDYFQMSQPGSNGVLFKVDVAEK